MGISRQQTDANRRAILETAARLFRQRGVDGVGLAELMKTAGFTTQGGFYNHFRSKDDLVAAVIDHEMQRACADLAEQIGRPLAKGEDPVLRQLDDYLSPAHRDEVAAGCAVAGFVGEAARLPPAAQTRYAEGVGATLDQLEGLLKAGEPTADGRARSRAVRLYSQMLGALVLSRAVRGADASLAAQVLEETRAHLAADRGGRTSPRRGRGAPLRDLKTASRIG